MQKLLTIFGLTVAAIIAIAAYPYIEVDDGKILVTDGKIQFEAGWTNDMPEALFTNCVLWQRFGSDEGTNYIDSSASNNNGQAVGTPVWTNFAGGCISNSTTSAVLMTNSTLIDNTASFSVCLWLYGKGAVWDGYFSIKGTVEFIFIAGASDATYPGYFGSRGQTAIVSGNSELRPDALSGHWSHLALTYNGGTYSTPANYTVYLNGVLITLKNGNTIGTAGTQANYLGKTGYETGFTGLLDDYRIYNRIITSNEAYSIYLAGSTNGTGAH